MSGPTSFAKTSVGLPDFEVIGEYTGSNPVIPHGNSPASDYHIREIGNVLYEPADTGREYKIWYTGYFAGVTTDEKIHHAYSSDGLSWTKSASNPVIADRRAEDPYVVKVGETYYLYAEDKEAGGAGEADMIRRWHSADGETWVDDGQITGLTNCQSPVVWVDGETWYLIYEQYPVHPYDIRLATSIDGLAWTDEPTNPVMSPGDTAWGATEIVPDDIIVIDSKYWMLYHGNVGGAFEEGIASSEDLLTWTDGGHNPLWTDEMGAYKPNTVSIVDDGEEVLYYYYGDNSGIYRGYPLKRV